MKKMIALSALALSLAGCASTFTNIERNSDGSYTLTRVSEGFFSINSNVYRCTESGGGLSCKPLN